MLEHCSLNKHYSYSRNSLIIMKKLNKDIIGICNKKECGVFETE